MFEGRKYEKTAAAQKEGESNNNVALQMEGHLPTKN